MRLHQTGLAVTLMCMASFAFSIEPAGMASLVTTSQGLGMYINTNKPAANIQLRVPPRSAVLVATTFDVPNSEFELCVDSEVDAPQLYLSNVGLDRGGKVAVCQQSEVSRFKINHHQPGKIVTLFLSPE